MRRNGISTLIELPNYGMDPRQLFIDERLLGVCAYCGAQPDTRDHVPSKILLDEPFPANLPVVDACSKCNGGFSLDEEYLACFIESVICGGTDNNKLSEKVAKVFQHNPALAKSIQASVSKDESGGLVWKVDTVRVRNVLLKLARGHLAFELGVLPPFKPYIIEFTPFPVIDDSQRAVYETDLGDDSMLLPEIGSRSFVNLLKDRNNPYGKWHVVQDNKYRYAVGQSNQGNWVKFVLSEYLACRVAWD